MITKERIKEIIGINKKLTLRKCSMCGYSIGLAYCTKGETLYWDVGCYCTHRHPQWEEEPAPDIWDRFIGSKIEDHEKYILDHLITCNSPKSQK